MSIENSDQEALIREKYQGDRTAEGVAEDLARLAAGEPLAYIIGHIPFLGLTIGLDSRPLIPRPETEWWTEELSTYVGNRPLRILDLCAGSGAIGISLLAHCPATHVAFGEISEMDADQISMNLQQNGIDSTRADIRQSDLFEAFEGERFDIIATNPPYIPDRRILDDSVTQYEPHRALYADRDGLSIIRRILNDASQHLLPNGEVWMECDIENIEEAAQLALAGGALRTDVRTDQYNRPRLLVAYY